MKIPPSEFYAIFGDWSELGIQNLVRMLLKKRYLMLQNTRFTAFTVFEYKGKPRVGGGVGRGKNLLTHQID